MRPIYPEMIGKKYGSLTVIRRLPIKGRTWLECACDCGNVVKTTTSNLTRIAYPKCNKCKRVTHGLSDSPTYRSWMMMIQRCTNPGNTNYRYYGAKGVTVCKTWLNSFDQFLKDMGERLPETTLDRIDPYGNYEPDNCRWATDDIQRKNKRKREVI